IAHNYKLIISAIFFFLAEDGIRYFHVTGVQTCALPIYAGRHHAHQNLVVARLLQIERLDRRLARLVAKYRRLDLHRAPASSTARSEERRVGKQSINQSMKRNLI